MRRDPDPHQPALRRPLAQQPERLLGRGGVAPEDLEVDGRPQPELARRCRGRARVAVVGRRRDPGGERVGDAAAGDRHHLVERERPLARDVRSEPGPELLPVAEARVDRVLEVRMGVDDARDDHGAVEVAVRPATGDLDDLPVLPGNEAVGERRAVDREHPAGGDGGGHVPRAAVLMRVARRSRMTESQIESS